MTQQYLGTSRVYGCAINPHLLLTLLCYGMRYGGGRWKALTALLFDPGTLFTFLLTPLPLSPHDEIHPGMACGVLALMLWSLQV